MTWLPTFEAQTLVSIIIGAIISIATYLLGQRRVRGAEHERISALNNQLVDAVIRRVAVDRQIMPGEHYEYVRSAKSQEAGINKTVLLTFEQAKARVFSAVIENDFLDVPTKNTIIDLLSHSIAKDESDDYGHTEDKSSPSFIWRINFLLIMISLLAGVFTSVIAASDKILRFMPSPSEPRSSSSGWVEILLLAAIAIFVGVRLYWVLRPREKIEKVSGPDDMRGD